MSGKHIFILLFSIVWLMIYLLSRVLPLKRYGLDIKPFLIKYESRRFKRFLYKCSDRQKVLWRVFSGISIFLGFGLMIFVTAFLFRNLVEAFFSYRHEVVVVPIIPGLTLDLLWLPYFLVAVLAAVFIHETAHGIVALIEGAEVKSAGLLVLAIFPGGFVEIEEDKINKLPHHSKLKIFSAGSSSNLIFGLITLLLILALFTQTPSGIVVINVLEDAPLHKAGIRRWDIIYALNNTRIATYSDLSVFMSKVKPGDKLVVSTSRGDLLIVSAQSPNDERKAIIGIVSPYLSYYPSLLGLGHFWDIQVYLTLHWLFIVLISVAIFNMLPIPMFDGDRFFQCLIERAAKRGSGALKKFFNILSLFLMIANIMLSLRAW